MKSVNKEDKRYSVLGFPPVLLSSLWVLTERN